MAIERIDIVPSGDPDFDSGLDGSMNFAWKYWDSLQMFGEYRSEIYKINAHFINSLPKSITLEEYIPLAKKFIEDVAGNYGNLVPVEERTLRWMCAEKAWTAAGHVYGTEFAIDLYDEIIAPFDSPEK